MVWQISLPNLNLKLYQRPKFDLNLEAAIKLLCQLLSLDRELKQFALPELQNLFPYEYCLSTLFMLQCVLERDQMMVPIQFSFY